MDGVDYSILSDDLHLMLHQNWRDRLVESKRLQQISRADKKPNSSSPEPVLQLPLHWEDFIAEYSEAPQCCFGNLDVLSFRKTEEPWMTFYCGRMHQGFEAIRGIRNIEYSVHQTQEKL